MKEMRAELIISIKLYGLEKKTIEFLYRKDSLENMDSLTFNYQNQEVFFEEKKEEILHFIKINKARYNLKIDPVDIELGENGIYIQKENHFIRALFQNILTKTGYVRLEDIVKNKMLKGNITTLYLADKQNRGREGYDSIFATYDPNILTVLELGIVTPRILDNIWQYLQTKKRFFSILRFLLLNDTREVMLRKFPESVPSQEEPCLPYYYEESMTRTYRSPYKDD